MPALPSHRSSRIAASTEADARTHVDPLVADALEYLLQRTPHATSRLFCSTAAGARRLAALVSDACGRLPSNHLCELAMDLSLLP